MLIVVPTTMEEVGANRDNVEGGINWVSGGRFPVTRLWSRVPIMSAKRGPSICIWEVLWA